MNTKIVSNLPVPGSGCGDIRFCFDNADVLLEFEFHNNGRDWIGGIHFGWDTAFRFRDEYRSLGFTDASYDALVEILNSEWITELKKNRISRENGFGDRSVISPFFLSSNGYFEVVAKSFILKLEIEGLLN